MVEGGRVAGGGCTVQAGVRPGVALAGAGLSALSPRRRLPSPGGNPPATIPGRSARLRCPQNSQPCALEDRTPQRSPPRAETIEGRRLTLFGSPTMQDLLRRLQAFALQGRGY